MSNPNVQPFMTGYLSQWHRSNFEIETRHFNCAEQYMMYKKASLFGDTAMSERILEAKQPRDHKRMGQQVKGFEGKTWDEHKIKIVTTGNREKFGQNPGLRKKLLATGNDILVEANAKDFIWGAGLAETDPDIFDPTQWRGQNLLGKILMQVRAELQ